MAAGSSHQRQLESFVCARVALRGSWVEDRSAWPPASLVLAKRLALDTFQWIGVRTDGVVRILGIRPLIEEPFFSLSALEKQGFRIESKQYVVSTPSDASAGHYWVAEITAPEKIMICACRYVLPHAWYVLEEHELRKAGAPRRAATYFF
jgi:hypothetical protein